MNTAIPVSTLGSSNRNLFEIPLRYDQIRVCRQIVDKHPHSKKCLEAIYSRLFRYGIEIMMGDKRAKLDSSLRNRFNDRCKTFCIEFIKCYYEMGIVPVSIAKTRNGERYPVVMKDMGFITISVDQISRKGKKFNFYKLFSKKTNKLMQHPKLDKSTIIFSGYGHDPDFDGEINSPVFAAVKMIIFTEKMFSCAFISEELNSKPVIVTEITNPEMYRSGKAMGTSIDVSLWYGNRDRQHDNMIDRVQVNENELMIMEHFNRAYIQSWNNMMSGTGMTMTGLHAPTTPLPVPIRSVPLGQKVTNGTPVSHSRGDLLQISEREEEILSNLFGVPKALFSGEVRTVGGTQMSAEMFSENIMGWRGRLSTILTQIFKCIYTDRICDIYEGVLNAELENQRKEKMYEEVTGQESSKEGDEDDMKRLLKQLIREKNISIQFPVIPYENSQELWSMYLRGVIKYSEFVVYSKMVTGLTVNDEDRESKEPWEKMFNLSFLGQTMDSKEQQVFQARFAPMAGTNEGKDNNNDKKKKRKKSDDSDSGKDKKKEKKVLEHSPSKQEKEKKKQKSKEDANEKKQKKDE